MREMRHRLRLPSVWLRVMGVFLALLTGTMDPAMQLMNTASAVCVIPASSTNDNVRVTEFSYDVEGRLAQVNSPEGVINYGYELANRPAHEHLHEEFGRVWV